MIREGDDGCGGAIAHGLQCGRTSAVGAEDADHTVMKIRDHMKNAMMANDTALDDFLKMIGSSDEEFFDYLLNIGEAYP